MKLPRQFLACFAGGFLMLGSSAVASETAEAQEAPPFHFAYEIAPVLARAGCSAAECHGGAAGKGGFKLSLFSSDPRADYLAITREFGARRVDYVAPEKSLFLRKPSKQLKHGGGRVLKTDDAAFQNLQNWIASGTPWQKGTPAELTSLQLKTDGDGVSVTAAFLSGDSTTERDVTDLAMLTSTNEGVATIADDGTVTKHGPGEAWILARYGHLNARTPILNPFSETKIQSRSEHPLDVAWLDHLAALGLDPSKRAPDAVLKRRLFLDLAGRPPSPLELARDIPFPEKVESLLKSEDFSKTWARHLGAWFEVPISERDGRNAAGANNALRQFFRTAMDRGESMADITRKILLEQTPQVAWKRLSDPRDRAEYIGRSMLGMRIGCARCHNHPLDRWKQDEHLQFSAFFSDHRPDPDGGGMMAGKFFEPETGRSVSPALLPLVHEKPPAGSREEQLAWFVLESDHDQFARNIANRTFAVLLGRPLVDSPDDHRLSNPAIHEPLLDLLAQKLTEDDYDLRKLIRFIVTSELYALSTNPADAAGENDPAAREFLARRESRRLSADEFRRAVAFVTGVRLTHPLPPESPLAEQLYVMNSGLIQKALATPGNQVDAIFDFGSGAEPMLEDLFLLILSRPPTKAERAAFLPELNNAADLRVRGKDLAFALLAGREFGSVR